MHLCGGFKSQDQARKTVRLLRPARKADRISLLKVNPVCCKAGFVGHGGPFGEVLANIKEIINVVDNKEFLDYCVSQRSPGTTRKYSLCRL